MERKYTLESHNASILMEEPIQDSSAKPGLQSTQRDSLRSSSTERNNTCLITGSGSDIVRTGKKARHQSKSQSHFTRPSTRRKGSQSQDLTETSNPTSEVFSAKKVMTKAGPKPSSDKETFARWLASLPEKFKAPLSETRQARSATISKRPDKRHPTVESQRIGRFLSSLPEEPSEYESTSRADSERIIEGLDRQQRSHTFPTFYQQCIKRSLSQEKLPTSADLLTEETDNDLFSGVTKSRLVHYASDDALNSTLAISKQTLREATDELKAFTATTTFLKWNSPTKTTPKDSDDISP